MDPTYELYAIRYATDVRTYSEHYYRYQTYGEPDRERPIDFFTWLAVSPGHVVMIDTGCKESVAAARGVEYLGAPHEALGAIGLTATAVDAVVLTHLHYDHAGHTDAYPDATFFLHRDELAFWTGPDLARVHFSAVIELDDILDVIRLVHAGRVRFTSLDPQVAPGIVTHHLPGHSAGQLAVEVSTARGPIILASDASHYYEEFERMRAFTVFSDLPALYDSYERLHRLARGDLDRIVPGHDPEVCTRFGRPAPGSAGRIVKIA